MKTHDTTKRILNALLAGEVLTPIKANMIGETTEGTRAIRKIRKKYPVRSERVAGELYHRYWIDEAFLMNLQNKR
jgi:hypothetical protein